MDRESADADPDHQKMIIIECHNHRAKRLFTLTFILGLGLLSLACGSSASYIAKGEEYLAKRKFHDAMMQFRTAAEYDGGSAKAHWGLARAYENLGMFNETLDELRKTVELDDTNLEAKAKVGTYFLLVDPPLTAEAQTIRDEIFAANENFIEGHLLTASIMATQGKPDKEIVTAVEKAIAIDPTRIEPYIALQRMYMTRENSEEAEKAIKRGIEANPSSPKGHTEYGRFLGYLSRDKESEEEFLKAITLDPGDIESREALADFYVTSRQFEKAERAYLDLVAVQENSPESRLELAGFYVDADRTDEAIATLDAIVAEVPDYALARYRLGSIYLDKRDVAKVNEHVEHLLTINNNDTEALLLRAKARLQENKPEEAAKDAEDVLKKTPSGKEPLFVMAQARLAAGQIDQANAFITDLERYHPTYLRAGLLRIQSAFTAGDIAAAHKLSNDLFKRVEAFQPNAEFDPQALRDLRIRAISSRGLASLQLNKMDEALYDLGYAVELSPRSSTAKVNYAKAQVASGKTEEALKLYESAHLNDKFNFDAISGVIGTLIKLGKHTEALERVAAFESENSGRGDVLAGLSFLRSTVHTAQKNNAAAETALLRAIELDANYFPAYSAYASLLIEESRSDEAVAQYKAVLEKRPSPQVYTLLGIVEDSRGNTTVAEAAYRRALELAPETPIAGNNLAWIIAEHNGNLDEALQLATMAATKGQGVAGFYDTLGWVYLKKGLHSPAVEQFRKAVALDDAAAKSSGGQSNAGYRVRLGMALAKAGDKTAARREVESSLKNLNALTQRELTEARNVLASL